VTSIENLQKGSEGCRVLSELIKLKCDKT